MDAIWNLNTLRCLSVDGACRVEIVHHHLWVQQQSSACGLGVLAVPQDVITTLLEKQGKNEKIDALINFATNHLLHTLEATYYHFGIRSTDFGFIVIPLFFARHYVTAIYSMNESNLYLAEGLYTSRNEFTTILALLKPVVVALCQGLRVAADYLANPLRVPRARKRHRSLYESSPPLFQPTSSELFEVKGAINDIHVKLLTRDALFPAQTESSPVQCGVIATAAVANFLHSLRVHRHQVESRFLSTRQAAAAQPSPWLFSISDCDVARMGLILQDYWCDGKSSNANNWVDLGQQLQCLTPFWASVFANRSDANRGRTKSIESCLSALAIESAGKRIVTSRQNKRKLDIGNDADDELCDEAMEDSMPAVAGITASVTASSAGVNASVGAAGLDVGVTSRTDAGTSAKADAIVNRGEEVLRTENRRSSRRHKK